MSKENNNEVDCPRIVIADDDTCFTEMLEFTLKRTGMEVIATTTNGKHAVEAAIETKPDCLLLDIAMPGMDGFAALANIKYLAPETRIIVLTALKDPCCRTRAYELGANAFLLKGERLVEKLTAIINTLVLREDSPPPSHPSPYPIFPTTPQIKLVVEDQEATTL